MLGWCDVLKLLGEASRNLTSSGYCASAPVPGVTNEKMRAKPSKLAERSKLSCQRMAAIRIAAGSVFSSRWVWAIRYLDDPSQRSLVRGILDPTTKFDTAYFIARVFLSRDDLSPKPHSLPTSLAASTFATDCTQNLGAPL